MLTRERDYLETYKKQKETELGWGDSNEWTSQDFEKLSELIFEKSGTRLSESTLKRVWGKVKYDSAPTVTTLNALAQFSGYPNWRAFKAANGFENGDRNGHSNGNHKIVDNHVEAPSLIPQKEGSFGKVVLFGVTGVALLLLDFFIFNFNSSVPITPIDLSQVRLEAKVVSNELPNSVIFNYGLGNNKVDSLILQQSWDPQRQEIVSLTKGQHTSIYYYPGFFKAKLIADQVILKEQDVFIKTDDWIGIIGQQPIPTYLSKAEINLRENRMSIERNVLTVKIGKTVFNNVWTDFYKVGDFGDVSSENFNLETTIQNTSTKEESVCQQAKITIITTKGAIVLPLSARGCVSILSVFNGETLINGKDTDLSKFGCDFSQPQKLKCKMQNKKMIVFLNDKEIFTSTHKSDLGKIVGLSIGFEGTGKITEISLK